MSREAVCALAGHLALFARMLGCRRFAATMNALKQEAASKFFWDGRRGTAVFMAALEELFEEWSALK